MRQLWRFLRILAVTVVYTLQVSWKARRLPPAEQARYRARAQQAGCRRLCRIFNFEVERRGAVPEQTGVLAVCNHFGVLDPFVLAAQLPVAFVGKAELRHWPFAGWVIHEMGGLFVERERRTATESFVQQVRRKLHTGVPVLVFPEGTTTKDLLPHRFKTGAFAAVAGMEEGAVLPLYLEVQQVEGRPAVGPVREQVTWANSPQTFLGHLWYLMGLESVHLCLHVGDVIPTRGHDRKALARLAHERVSALAPEGGAAAAASRPARSVQQ